VNPCSDYGEMKKKDGMKQWMKRDVINIGIVFFFYSQEAVVVEMICSLIVSCASYWENLFWGSPFWENLF